MACVPPAKRRCSEAGAVELQARLDAAEAARERLEIENSVLLRVLERKCGPEVTKAAAAKARFEQRR